MSEEVGGRRSAGDHRPDEGDLRRGPGQVGVLWRHGRRRGDEDEGRGD